MIDWHSHILPGMDDGSRDLAESTAMLQMLWQQGVQTVVATPHFYANHESVERFCRRRETARTVLTEAKLTDVPEILCGAEVRYYPGISRMEELKRLCIEGTDLLLLEMPENTWTEYTVRELEELAAQGSVRLILAHIERCMDLQSDSTRQRLYGSGILMQSNAGNFLRFSSKRRALKDLRHGRIHLLGSDCHDLKSRPPQMGEARAMIEKKLGSEYLTRLDKQGSSLLKHIHNEELYF